MRQRFATPHARVRRAMPARIMMMIVVTVMTRHVMMMARHITAKHTEAKRSLAGEDVWGRRPRRCVVDIFPRTCGVRWTQSLHIQGNTCMLMAEPFLILVDFCVPTYLPLLSWCATRAIPVGVHQLSGTSIAERLTRIAPLRGAD